jgi:hypothetical protein
LERHGVQDDTDKQAGAFKSINEPVYVRSAMYLYELTYPGTWLQLESDEVRFEIEGALRALEGILTEAAIALSMFEESQSQRPETRKKMLR